MASQSAAKQDHDDVGDDQQVPQASGPRQESSKMPKLNGNLEDSNISNGPLSADVPVNSLGNGASTDVSPSSAVCASQNGACPGYPCLNGFLPGRPRTAAIVSFQPNCPPNSSEVLDEVGAFRSNGSTPHACEGDDGDCVDQRVPESEAASFSQDTRKRGSRPKKVKKRHRTEQRHGRNCVNGLSQSDEEENAEASAKENVLTCTGFAGYEHAAVLCNGVGPDNSVQASHSSDSRQRHNNHSHGLNNLPHQEPPVPRRDEDADCLDMVDEGAVCDFDRNVFVDENSFCFPEDASIPLCVASSNIGGDYQNGHASRHGDEEYSMRHRRRQVRQYYSPHFQYYTSDSDDDAGIGRVPNVAGGEEGPEPNRDRQDPGEDNGDFIDADLPSVPGQLLSSSADSASLSSSNGDLAEPPLDRFPADRASSSRQENNLSGGSDKELNHRPESPDARAVPDNAMYRTSYSSQSHDGGFDNFLAPQELSSSDGVFGNSSESENEEELSETLPLDGQDGVVPVFEGAGVAEAMASPHSNEQGLDGHQFGAVGDLCFHFDSACSLRENEWQPEHTASSMPPSFLAGQSAARHDPCPHLPVNSPAGGEGEAGGACAPPPPPVNNLSRLHPVTPGARAMESMANGLDDVAPSNFINDESNRQQKVFVKFPMMQEGRDGACGSGAGQGKCEGDNVRCPCPGPQGSAYNSSADMGMEPDQANLPGSLGPNVESFGGVLLPDYKHSPREMQWFTNSESGVSEPIYEEISDFQVCPDPDCSISHNALHPAVIKKGSKDGKKPKRIVCRIIENGVDGASVDRVMIWNEYEAYLLQVKQIGMSACGQTAVLNLLKAFDSPAEKRDVCSKIHVNLRKEKASVAEYLASRAVAGTTAEELLAGVERLTKGELRGRFFPFWPPRDVQLLSWISLWMKKGAVPIATLNLQLGVKQQQVPDAWHHQMVYGVGPRGVYLTNPLEIVPEETMMEQLTSDSVLLVRRQDVVSRFQPTASLAPLMCHQDPRWCTMNILGQVVNVLREHNMPSVPGYRAQVTSHVRIPAVYRAGVTLFVRHNTEEWKALRDAPDLPRKTDRQDSGVE